MREEDSVQVVNIATSQDGTSIAFERAGTGPPLILVDAAGGYRGFGPMGPLAVELQPEFTVYRYDRRGRGDSTDNQPYSVDREIDDLQALIDAADGSAFVYGFSSGAVLALHAAARGLAISKLALLEPPIELGDKTGEPDPLGAEVAELVAAGRRGDAVEHFNRSIGVPEEYLVGMRDAPWWPGMEALAHTLVYDTIITSSLPTERLAAIATPTLIIDSQGSDPRLSEWAQGVADALPNAQRRTLSGEWHGIEPDVLAPVLTEFFKDASARSSPGRSAQMIATQPSDEKNLDGYGSEPLTWERVTESLDQTRDLEALDAAGRYWLATTGPDGRPHVMPAGIVWDDGKFYFTSGAGTQKSKNLARDPHCVITVAAPQTDVVVEGEARIVRDEAELKRIAALFSDWGPEVRDGAFWHEYSAPSAGPPPWDVYEVTPSTLYGLSTGEPHGATRWRM